MDLISVSRDLLKQTFDSGDLVLKEITQTGTYYAVAGKGTTKADWLAHKHKAYVIQDGLCLFLNIEEARKFAEIHDVPDMIITLTNKAAMALVKEYANRGCIANVRIYAVLPVFATVSTEDFLRTPAKQADEPAPGPAAQLQIPPEVIDRAKKVLDTGNPNERSQMDSCGSFRNLHAMIDRLLRDSKVSPDTLDEALGLPKGTTARFCSEMVDNRVPLRVAKQYLEVFDLSAYLYQFKGECAEIASEIGASQLDVHQIKPASVQAKEPFTLKSVRRGKDANGCYVYQLFLAGEYRNVTELVSSPLGYIEGKKYTVVGLEDLPEQPGLKTVTDDKADAVMSEINQRLHISDHKGPVDKKEQQKSDIIRYMKASLGYSAKESEEKMASIYWEDDLFEEMWNYVKNHKSPKIRIRGYTAAILMKELHFTPIEAYQQMVGLRKNPRETEQMLKYRRTDPQYQK